MSAMDTDHPYTDDTFHTHLAYHRERAGEVWAGCKWCMRERPDEQVAAVRALARQEAKEILLEKLRDEYYNTTLVPQIDAWLKEIAQQRNLAAIRGAEIQLRELFASAIDRESEHIERDRIILEFLDVLAPEVATLVRDREDEVGYWYA